MKRTKIFSYHYFKLIIIAAVQLLTFSPAFAQTGSVKTEYSEESAEASDYTLKEKYDYLIRAKVEEKNLFKVGLSEFAIGPAVHKAMVIFAPNLSFEHKLTPSFSLFLENKFHFNNETIFRLNALEISLAPRYYYNMGKRIREGKSANNFSGNYFSLQPSPVFFFHNTIFRKHSSLSLLYGMQRRIRKYGYVDINIGPDYILRFEDHSVITRSRWGLDINFSIGLGF